MANKRVIDGDALGLLRKVATSIFLRAEKDMDQAEAPPDQARVAEQIAHLLRMRIGGNVEVFRAPPEHQIAHAASHQVGVVGRQ